MMAWYRIS